MRLVFILLLFIGIDPLGFSQRVLSKNTSIIVVADSATSKGINGATLNVSNKLTFVTDSHGLVVIDKNLIKKLDSINVSSIGYKLVGFKFTGSLLDTILLEHESTMLKEVSILTNTKKLIVGNAKEYYDGGYFPGLNEEVGEFIPNDNKIEGVIVVVSFNINIIKKGIAVPFFLNIYSRNDDHMNPDKKLIMDSVIIYSPKKSGKVSINIAKFNIRLPANGVFICLQTPSIPIYKKYFPNYHMDIRMIYPGINGHFNNHEFNYDNTKRTGVRYALKRNLDFDEDWSIFEDGTDFNITATVISD